MKGKIFPESANLYQDQAKVLFDYYKRAAEKIVAEEVQLENSIAQAEAVRDKQKKNKLIAMIVFPLCFVLALIMLIMGNMFLLVVGAAGGIAGLIFFLLSNKNIKAEESRILGFSQAHTDIRRDYKVSKMGVAYVPVATRVPFEKKSFLVDHTGSVGNTDFKLSVLHKPEEFQQSLAQLESGIESVPVVESASATEEIDTADYSTSIQNVTMYDYLGNIDRQVRNISYLLNDNDTVFVSLPVVEPASSTDQALKEYATTDTENNPVVTVFDMDTYQDKLVSLATLNEMKKQIEKQGGDDNIEYFKKLMKRLAESVQILSKTKTGSCTKVLDYSNAIFSAVLKASFNQYSPSLEAEEIERIRASSFDYQESVDDYTPFTLKSSSRVKYDLFSGSWVAEDGSRTNMPFGMHQIQEEVLMPVIHALMQENRIERLKIYNGIKDQKTDYLNQWHRDTEDFYGRNRAEANDLINRMREAYADYMSSFNTYKSLQQTQEAMKASRSLEDAEIQERDGDAEMIAGFELQAAQCNQKQEEFTSFMERIKDDIDEKAAKFGHIEYYEASLRDSESRDIARSFENLNEMDERRKKLLPISSYFAKFSTLPPEPQMEPCMMEDFTIDLIQEAQENLDRISAQEAEAEREANAAQSNEEQEVNEPQVPSEQAESVEADQEPVDEDDSQMVADDDDESEDYESEDDEDYDSDDDDDDDEDYESDDEDDDDYKEKE